MNLDGSDLVALIALVSNVIITLATLRHQRNRALQDRIWERRTDVYDEYLGWAVDALKAVDDHMRAAEVMPHSPIADINSADGIRMLNRLMMFSSNPVRTAATEHYDTYLMWGEAYSMWAKAPQDEQLAQRATDLAETTHLLGEKLGETIRREILTGRPVWLRLAS
ncbi:hypothetical protein [Microtetraspora glauca]|uniref:DUF4760 domain-containing protein n=1 Tax=Microtetraspora glauca TaxID=1996 RepID=A0ABV3GJE7_MICGL